MFNIYIVCILLFSPFNDNLLWQPEFKKLRLEILIQFWFGAKVISHFTKKGQTSSMH